MIDSPVGPSASRAEAEARAIILKGAVFEMHDYKICFARGTTITFWVFTWDCNII